MAGIAGMAGQLQGWQGSRGIAGMAGCLYSLKVEGLKVEGPISKGQRSTVKVNSRMAGIVGKQGRSPDIFVTNRCYHFLGA